jgi:lipoprotein-releasing system permease protein
LVQGRIPKHNPKLNEEVVISSFSQPFKFKSRFFLSFSWRTMGITYGTLLLEYLIQDFRIWCHFILGDIRHMQRINKWKPNQVGSFWSFGWFWCYWSNRDTNKQVPHSIQNHREIQLYIFEWNYLILISLLHLLVKILLLP